MFIETNAIINFDRLYLYASSRYGQEEVAFNVNFFLAANNILSYL